MAYRRTEKKFNYFDTLLARMAEAHVNSGTPLRDDLKATLHTVHVDLKTHINAYISLQGQKSETGQLAGQLQVQGERVLRKVRQMLKSQLPDEVLPAVLQVYHLDRELPRARGDLLGRLRLANEAVGQQSEELRKPPQDLQTELQDTFEALNEKLAGSNGVEADLEEARRNLQESMEAAADIRERSHAYLKGVLPGGAKDPLLIDYGLRRRFADKPGTQVTVVNQEEEPVVGDWRAPSET